MARGVFGGFVAGTLVSGVVLGTVSVLTPVPGADAPEATALEVPAGSEFNQSLEDTQASLPALEVVPEGPSVPRIAAPEPDDIKSLQMADTAPAALPETGPGDATLESPAAEAREGGIDVSVEKPVLPSPQAVAPKAPADEENLSISTEPAQPVQPEVAEQDTAFSTIDEPEITETQTPETTEADTAENEIAVLTEPEQPALPVIEEESSAFPKEDTPEPQAVETESSVEVPATGPETVEPSAPEAGDEENLVVVDGIVEVPPQNPVEEAPKTATEPATEAGAEEETSSVVSNLAPDVTTDRLPSVNSDAEAEPAAVEDDIRGEEEKDSESLPAIERFAAEFENPDNKPMMSIILIDNGTSPIGLDALKSFPYPLSFAVDSAWPGAGEAAKKYRDAGFEVLAMVNLPETANARDTEVAMQSYFEALPGAVAVMEGEGTGLQSSRAASDQLGPILLESGHGLVMFPKGLNTAQKLIARLGVPAASVFRDFDASGQDASTIRRFLDKAAFKASQGDAGIIMVGRLRADTISALLLWGLQDRANRVALAPVSAVLLAQ